MSFLIARALPTIFGSVDSYWSTLASEVASKKYFLFILACKECLGGLIFGILDRKWGG